MWIVSCVQLDSKNSPLAMLARTCNSIGKDSVPSKGSHQSQQQQPADKKDSSTRLIKSTSPGKKSSVGVEGVTSCKDQSSTSSSTLSRQSTAAAGRGRSSSSPTSSQLRPCRDGDCGARRGDGSRWTAVNDGGRALSSGGSPASTSRTADSDRDSVDDLRCSAAGGRHHDKHQGRHGTLSSYSSSDAQPSLGLYDSLRLQQEAAALQAAVYSPLHQLLAQRHFTDPLAMYSASLQAAAVVAAAAAQASLHHAAAGRLQDKDYRLGDVFRPCGVDATDVVSNGDVNGTVFSAAGMLPLRPPIPPVGHSQQPYTCSWLMSSGGEFCAQRFSTSEELFAHLRTHVDGAAASEDPLRGALPPAASCSAFVPNVGGFLCGQSGSFPVAGPFGGSAASLAAAHAAASFYRSKVQRSRRAVRDTAAVSPTSSAGGGSLFIPAAAAAVAASSRYHPYKWTPSPFVASQLASALGTATGLPNSDLAPPALSAFLQQPSYAGLFSAQTLGAAVP